MQCSVYSVYSVSWVMFLAMFSMQCVQCIVGNVSGEEIFTCPWMKMLDLGFSNRKFDKCWAG